MNIKVGDIVMRPQNRGMFNYGTIMGIHKNGFEYDVLWHDGAVWTAGNKSDIPGCQRFHQSWVAYWHRVAREQL